MALFLGDLRIKYELLESRRKKWYQCIHWWVLVGATALLLSVLFVSLIIIWDKIEEEKRDVEELDYVLFGPDKDTSDLIRISEHRALMYAYNSNASKEIKYPDLPGNKLFNTFQHVDKSTPYLLTCYYVMPNQSDPPNRLFPQDINASLCSHIIISFAVVRNCTIPLPNEYEATIYEDLLALKKNNTNLKILISVISSGSVEDSFGDMVVNISNRKIFIESALKILKDYSLDGIDIDWEFPAWPQPVKSHLQKTLFMELLKEMRQAFGKKYLLTVAVAAPIIIVQVSYDVPQMATYVDYVNIMCYDYHGYTWLNPFTGPNAPLYQSKVDVGYITTLNVNYTIYYWMLQGMPKNKIIVGMPTYGHSWTLMYAAIHGYRAIAKGFGLLGGKGFVSQRDICAFISWKDTTVVFDAETAVPYAYRGTEWISYDNQKSLAYKAELVTELGLAGAMIFSLNQDDFTGNACGKGPFPLIRAIRNVLEDDYL